MRMHIRGNTGLDNPVNVSSHKNPMTVQPPIITILPKNIKNADIVLDIAICAPCFESKLNTAMPAEQNPTPWIDTIIYAFFLN